MRTIICGSRHGLPEGVTIEDAVQASGFEVTEVVHGGARGVDTSAHMWGLEKGLGVVVYHADWSNLGRSAGPIRNRKMAENAEACIALPGGAGTRNMVKQAREHGLQVYLHGWKG